MKVCIVPTMFPKYKGDYYGIFVFDEAKALVQKGIEVHIVTPYNEGAVYNEVWEGINIHRFRWLEPKPFKALVHFKGLKDHLRMITYFISLFLLLIKIVGKYKIDIVHAHSVIPTGFVGAIIAVIFRVPYFITAHGMDMNLDVNFFYRNLISFSLNHCDKAIAVSESLRRQMQSLMVEENKVILLRNAIDTKVFNAKKDKTIRNKYGIDEKDLIILFVGYLDVFKGIFEMISSFKEIYARNKSTKLMMIGDGPKKDKLERIVAKFGLKDQIIFTGKISPDYIYKYYQSADIFVLPSYGEGGGPPLVIIEAMACGLPVVATDVGGIPEVVRNNINGLLVPSQNKKELVKKLDILVQSKELRYKIGKKAKETINEEFNINKKADKLIDLYTNKL